MGSRRFIPSTLFAAGIFFAVLTAAPKARASGLDVQAWLSRPGVKLVAVEFYATWCKPCMEAVPRWKALHEKYREQGLRLIVVATQDPQAGCVNPGWNPDEVVCDDEGFVARAFGADQRLPAAFLWSWQGNLLVRNGHVDQVEKAVEAWATKSPRVAISVDEVVRGSGTSKRELQTLLRSEISREDKLVVVASAEERRRLDALRRESFKGRYDDKLQCEVGQELSANSMLQARLVGKTRRQRLSMSLLSAERGCLVGSSVVDWNRRRPAVSIAEGVAELMQGLRHRPETPRGGAMSRQLVPQSTIAPRADESWEPQAVQRAIVEFTSAPVGAVVMVDGKLLCASTAKRCARELTLGPHTVSMQAERYVARTEQVRVTEGAKLSWRLEPDFGTISFAAEPAGVPFSVKIDGTPRSGALEGFELGAGAHRAEISGDCVRTTQHTFRLARGENKRLPVKLQVHYAGLDVSSVDGEGNAVPAQIVVDGEVRGKTPGVLKVSACAKSVEVRHATLGTWRSELQLKPRTTQPLRAVFTPTRTAQGGLPGPVVEGEGKLLSRGSKFSIGDRVEITNKGNAYTTINRTKCLSWPNATVKTRGGKDGWGGWAPKDGDVAQIVAFVRHCSQKRDLAILRFGDNYLPISELGLRRAGHAPSNPVSKGAVPAPNGSVYASMGPHLKGSGRVLTKGSKLRVGDRVKIVEQGKLYSTINETDCLTWPSADFKRKAGAKGWRKGWYPKDGMRGRAVGFVAHCAGGSTLVIVDFGGSYAVFGEKGLSKY